MASYARIVLVLIALLVSFAGLMAYRGIRQEAKRTRARTEMMEVPKAIGIWRTMVPPMPESLDDLRRGRPMTQEDADAFIGFNDDPWGHPYVLTVDGPGSFSITCLGADGAPGGEGACEDIVLHGPPAKDSFPR